MSVGLQEAAARLAGQILLSGAPGEQMARLRHRYGFTQAWLSEHLGVRRESLSRIESQHSTPTSEVVAQFARIMALVQHVREETARLEAAGGSPSPSRFREAGSVLGLEPTTTTEIAREALASYSAKRAALLEGLHGPEGGTG